MIDQALVNCVINSMRVSTVSANKMALWVIVVGLA